MPIELAFVDHLPDPAAFEVLMGEYYAVMGAKLVAAGGPEVSPEALAQDTLAQMDTLLPPQGRTLLAHNSAGHLIGCGVIRKVRDDAAELKRMFVRPEAQGLGLGRRLFEMRLEEAKNMGCTVVYADTVKGNRAMLSMYVKLGFDYIPRYPENANPPGLDPYLVYLSRELG